MDDYKLVHPPLVAKAPQDRDCWVSGKLWSLGAGEVSAHECVAEAAEVQGSTLWASTVTARGF